MPKIEGLKTLNWICYASCHRFQGLKNENIRAGALLYKKMWLIEVKYQRWSFKNYTVSPADILEHEIRDLVFTCLTLILGS